MIKALASGNTRRKEIRGTAQIAAAEATSWLDSDEAKAETDETPPIAAS